MFTPTFHGLAQIISFLICAFCVSLWPHIFVKNNKSAYYLSLGISYPNVEDAARGLRDGLITKAQHDAIVEAIRNKTAPPQYTKLGGLIYIHGHGARSDWTWGCVALENDDIKELYDAVSVGTPVTIKP